VGDPGSSVPPRRWTRGGERELSEETGVDAASLLTQFGAYGDPGVRVEREVTGIATAFVGATFTLAELRAVYEAVWGVQLDAANFRRSIVAEDGCVIPTGRRARPGSAGGRPAELYRAGRAWNHGGPIHRLQRTEERK
jgi:hypothetical protein